jgi:amino acid transporter
MSHTSPATASIRKATTFQLVFMTYAVICSGAYGLEEMVSEAGPGMAILTLCVLPFVWAVPLALACAELSSCYPVEGGYYRWARMAFGDFTGYMAGWLVWLANLATNGIFAVLFANYLGYWIDLSPAAHHTVAVALVWAATYMNYRGIRIVGSSSVVMTLLIFLPFLGMTLLGLLQWKFNPLVPFTPPDKTGFAALLAGLPIAIWLYSGFEKLTTAAAEVERPSRAFPIALAFAVPMTAGTYILPTVAALAANGDWSAWGESHYSVAAREIGGSALGMMMAAGGLISNFCILMVTLLGQSRLPMVMAEDGLFPGIFRKVSPRLGTPVISLLAGGLCLSILCFFRFSVLAGLFSFVQVFAYLLIFASLFRLRARPPATALPAAATSAGPADGPRDAAAPPFRIPLGLTGLVLMTLPSFVISAFVVVESVRPGGAFDPRQALVDLAVFASGPVTYLLLKQRSRG